jgi:hypothetical protein
MGVHSFDRPRDREAPTVLEGHWLNGESVRIELTEPTLIVAIKPQCDGCRDFVESDLAELDGVNVVIVSAHDDADEEWVNARQPVLVAPLVLELLDVRWPPVYVMIDPTTRRVLTEGVLFAPAQVASEIGHHLRS